MGDSFRFIAVLEQAILMLANLMQISKLNVFVISRHLAAAYTF